MTDPHFPPLFRGEALTGNADPMERAVQLATAGTEPGLITYNITAEQMRAAIIFTPEVPLEDALIMLPACGIGFQNALGSLAPPEVAVHLEWPGAIRVNGANCGKLRLKTSADNLTAEPDWLAVSIEIDLSFHDKNPGDNPQRTALMEEGCADVEPPLLLEGWARHTLYWINRWTDEGAEPLHREWRGLAHDLGSEVDWGFAKGIFVGLDEKFNALLRNEESTTMLPLSMLLET